VVSAEATNANVMIFGLIYKQLHQILLTFHEKKKIKKVVHGR
jgi:hypothetical protein